jgi:tripartite-type tricarboxylate transporter receptor subunit TctC
VSIVGTSPFVVTVGAAVPATTLPAFIAYVKARAGQIPFGSAGTGSLSHVSSAIFLKSAGLDMVHVPYRGLGSAFTDLIAGHVSMVMATPVELKSYLDSGKIRPLAVTATTRSKQLPDVPTVAETLPSPPSITLNGLVAPGRTPQEIVDTLAREIIAAEKTPAFQERLVRIGVDPIVATPQEFAEIIAADTARWRDIVRELDLKPH